jgi:hypothetical protein
MWWKKANFFTLVAELARHPELSSGKNTKVAAKLLTFAQNVPKEYSLAAREAVGRRAQRELMGKAIRDIFARSS